MIAQVLAAIALHAFAVEGPLFQGTAAPRYGYCWHP